MEANLVLFRRDGQMVAIPLKKGVNVVGRRTDCDVRIPEGIVSRKHCRIVKTEQEIKVQDLGSANGTYVNRERVMEAAVGAGDRLAVGSVIFTVQVDGRPEKIERPTEAAPKPADKREQSGSGVAMKPVAKQPTLGQRTDDDVLADLEEVAGNLDLDDSKI